MTFNTNPPAHADRAPGTYNGTIIAGTGKSMTRCAPNSNGDEMLTVVVAVVNPTTNVSSFEFINITPSSSGVANQSAIINYSGLRSQLGLASDCNIPIEAMINRPIQFQMTDKGFPNIPRLATPAPAPTAPALEPVAEEIPF